MKRSTIELQIASDIEDQAREIAKGDNCSVESVLEDGLALLFGSLGDVYGLLDRLNSFGDDQLWELIHQRLTPSQDQRMRDLLYRGSEGTVTSQEKSELGAYADLIDRHMLLRSQALVLLKERGHDIETYLKANIEES